MQALAQPYPDVPEARLAVAQAAWNADNQKVSLEEARAALKLRPDWEIAALFVAQVLQRQSNEAALRYLNEYLRDHPKARDARLNYARLLVATKSFPEARRQFEVLVEDYPENADVGMAVALLAMQANDYEAAETQLQRVLKLNYKDPELARYSGHVADSGEGRWTIDAAVEQGTPANVLAASLFARFRSRQDATFGDKMLSAMRAKFGGHQEPK